MGWVVIVVQMAIAAIPCALYQDWAILFLTGTGTVLALATGALPQWKFEKWACRRKTTKVISLTGGNGTRHVMVIIGKKLGLDLEDLAAAESPRMRRRGEEAQGPGRWSKSVAEKGVNRKETRMVNSLPAAFWITRAACSILALLWIIFLITVTALHQHTWYLLAVGGIGMIQNVVVAAARRDASASGIYLTLIEEFEQSKAMDALMDLETAYKGVGKSLVSEFFPESNLRPAEVKWWDGKKEDYDRLRKEKRPLSLAAPDNVSRAAEKARDEHAKRLLGD